MIETELLQAVAPVALTWSPEAEKNLEQRVRRQVHAILQHKVDTTLRHELESICRTITREDRRMNARVERKA